jgi:pentapeptide MXKDX repeat protein
MSRLRVRFLTAAGIALCAVAQTGVAFAHEATPKPDAMSADHMSSDHMSGMMNKPGMEHKAKHNMMKGDAMSKDHMAPDEPKQ